MIVLNFQVFKMSVVHSYSGVYVYINLPEIVSSLQTTVLISIC